MLGRSSSRKARLGSVAGVVALSLAAAACGRSSSTPTSTNPGGAQPTAGSSSTPSSTASAAGVGDFGTLKGICGPGTAKGATSRGVTDSEIHLGTSADPGAAAAPGLEQEFFDVADAFTKWCNAAGGINGRTIALDKWDAKLFESAAQVINACRKDFMLVGNGNAVDAPMQKPRVACHLGQIASYVVSPEAVSAPESLSAQPANNNQYPVGGIRLLAEAYPDSKTGIGIGSSTIASITPTGKRAKEASEKLGYKVTTLQERPALVDNYRPYMEEMKGSKTKGYNEIVAQDPAPEVQAMQNVGWNPDWVLWGTQFYSEKSVQAAKSVKFPPSYVYLAQLPFDLTSQFPVLQQVKSIMTAGVSKPQYTTFTALAFNAWTLWAKSATACGSTLTESCVLDKAGSETAWDAGGLFPPRATDPKKQQVSDCFAMVKLTANGFQYDRSVTKPNNGVYNCSPKNVGAVQSYQ